MKKSWKLLDKILTGEKTIESRWYKFRRTPWNKVNPGDIVYFKNSGQPITVQAAVSKVVQFNNLTPTKIKTILKTYGQQISGNNIKLNNQLNDYYHNKNYCILIFFNQVQKIKPFKINKTGFGSQAAWIVIDNINKIKKQVKFHTYPSALVPPCSALFRD